MSKKPQAKTAPNDSGEWERTSSTFVGLEARADGLAPWCRAIYEVHERHRATGEFRTRLVRGAEMRAELSGLHAAIFRAFAPLFSALAKSCQDHDNELTSKGGDEP